MSRPSLRKINFWQRFEKSVLETFGLALKKLAAKDDLPSDEDTLNRILRTCVFEAIKELNFPDEQSKWALVYEGNNQPSINDVERAKREDKRPDFQCMIFDRQELNPHRGQKILVIECKRLGLPTSSSWVLNKNYIENGVLRFIKKDWGYGADFKSGAMIGYVQNSSFECIFEEVCICARKHSIEELSLSKSGWKVSGVSHLDHAFFRVGIEPERFRLVHLWVDLR